MPYKEFDVSGIGTIKIYKRRGSRSLRLTIAADGSVRVSIPYWTPYQAGLAFTVSRKAWITAQNRTEAMVLAEGMAVGKTRVLHFVPSPETASVKTSIRSTAVVVTYNLDLHISDPTVQKAAQSACYRALKAEAVQLLTPRLNELTARYGFTYRSLNVKRMKTRWGSCDQHQNIVLNVFLTQLPSDCIDYVILHELTHTRALHHGADFWQKFEEVLPGARRMRKTMRSYRPVLGSFKVDS